MKTLKGTILVCLLSIASFANAQFANSSASAATTTSQDGWDNFHISYNSTSVDVDGSDFGIDNIMGIEVGYTKVTPISNTMPLFLEAGASVVWAFGDLYDEEDDYYDYKYKCSASLLSVKVPFNLIYKFDVNEKFSVLPFAGVYLKGNISGTLTLEQEDYYDSYSEDLDIFDEDEGDGERFQYGMNIGAKCKINNCTLGVSYAFDFNELMEDTKVSSLNLSVGFNF